MRITGTVRVDMSPFLMDPVGLLYFGDKEVAHLWRSGPVAAPLTCELWIGGARQVQWTPRAIEALLEAQSVWITGTDLNGVQNAMASLQAQFEGRAA